MALLQLHYFTVAATSPASATADSTSLLSSLSTTVALNAHHLIPRLCKNPFAVYPKPHVLRERSALVAKASFSSEGADLDEPPEPPSESEEENIPIQNLPLESKLQPKLEQKMTMKLAKKIRLRGKKLVRKHRLRKKGRWPPSKLKKNKNV